jgi:hypothetical protein
MAGTGDDETSEGPPPRPSPLKRKREAVVIEGRASKAGPLRAPAAVPQGALAVGALGGVIGAALALAGVWMFVARPDLGPFERRVVALEAGAQTADARMAALETAARSAAERLKAALDAEAKLQDRIAALEATVRDQQTSVETLKRESAQQAKSAAEAGSTLERRLATLEGSALRADALDPLAAEARAAKEAADKALAAAGAPAADPRLDRLAADQAELAALRADLDKLAAPKAETRVSPSERAATAGPSPAARAVAAMALRDRLAAGEPLGATLGALDRLGVPAEALAPLRPYADKGAPTLAALARALNEGTAEQPASAAPGGVAQRLLGEVQGLVKVRKVGETRPRAADGSQVEAALAAGDLARALEAFAALPPAAQAAAQDWRENAEARLAADRAADALVDRAVADLGAGR